ncbi:hypothetical protein ACFL6G_06625 [candidate division KSB1 bacterium]
MNVVFMTEKESLIDKIKQFLPSFEWFKVKPVMKLGYGLAAVFLFLSVTNFQFSYNPDTGDFKFATSLFGSSADSVPETQITNDLLTQQLIESQNKVFDMVTQVLSVRENNQNEQIRLAFYDLMQNIENQRNRDIQEFGQTVLTNFLDPQQQKVNDLDNKLAELIKTIGGTKKQQ